MPKAGGRGILSHRLSEYVLPGLVRFADFRRRNGTTGVQVAELALDVGLQARTVVAFEAAELLYLALQDGTLLFQCAQDLAGLLLCVVDKAAGFDLRFRDD